MAADSTSSASLSGGASYVADENDEVDREVADVVNQFGLPADQLPVRLDSGQYQFGAHTIVYVRMIRNMCLVRFREEWVSINKFVLERMRESEDDRRRKEKEREQEEETSSSTSFSSSSSSTATTNNDTLSDSSSSVPRKESLQHNTTAHREFFYMTCLAVKLNHVLREENICQVSNDKLFNLSVEQGVPFHQFYAWIDQEITKAYLEALITTRQSTSRYVDPLTGSVTQKGGLRASRRQIMRQLRARHDPIQTVPDGDEEEM